MARTLAHSFVAAVLLCGASAALAKPGSIFDKIKIGPDISTYIPSSSATRAQFGSNWFAIGIGIGRMDDPDPRGRIGPDVDLFYRTTGNGHAFILPAGVAYERGFGRSGDFMPYAGIGVYAVLADLRADSAGVQSGFRSAWASSLFMGAHYGKHALVEARYYGFTKVNSIDLSGLSLKAGYRF